MGRLKRSSDLFIAFLGGLVVASLAWFAFYGQTSGGLPNNPQLIEPKASIPMELGGSIQLQHNVGSMGHLKTPFVPNRAVETSNSVNLGNQPVSGAANELPVPEKVVKPPPVQEMIELPVESEVFDEAPEPETLQNTTDMAVSEEPPEPEIVENAPIPNYPTNK